MAALRERASSDAGDFRLVDCSGMTLLYRVTTRGDRLVIPATQGLRTALLTEMHDALLSGHLGARKTSLALGQRVWWPHMDRDVRTYVGACPVC